MTAEMTANYIMIIWLVEMTAEMMAAPIDGSVDILLLPYFILIGDKLERVEVNPTTHRHNFIINSLLLNN